MESDHLQQFLAEIEERICTCGAGHGSGEGHTDWCEWVEEYSCPPAPEAQQQPVAEALELSGNTGELIDKMAEAIRGDTVSDDTPWATLSEDRKIGWRGDAERALAVVKEYLTARRPSAHGEAGAVKVADHERIWLEPEPGSDPDYGRMWAQNDVWGDGTEYVLASQAAADIETAYRRGREDMREEAAKVAECHSDDRPGRDRNFEWNDGYIDGCRGAAAAIRSLAEQGGA